MMGNTAPPPLLSLENRGTVLCILDKLRRQQIWKCDSPGQDHILTSLVPSVHTSDSFKHVFWDQQLNSDRHETDQLSIVFDFLQTVCTYMTVSKYGILTMFCIYVYFLFSKLLFSQRFELRYPGCMKSAPEPRVGVAISAVRWGSRLKTNIHNCCWYIFGECLNWRLWNGDSSRSDTSSHTCRRFCKQCDKIENNASTGTKLYCNNCQQVATLQTATI